MRHYQACRVCCLIACLTLCPGAEAQQRQFDAAQIERLTGAKPAFNKDENVLKVSFPRNDVKVTVDGSAMPPFMGLTSWASFMPGMKTEAMVMGDLVLFQDEVNPAMDVAFANRLSVTALHNHFFYDEPKVYFMHIGGEGSTQQLAGAVRKALDKVNEIRAATPEPGRTFGKEPLPPKSSITTARLTAILGGTPAEKDGMVKFVIGRTTKMPCGCNVGKEMGVNTWAAFAGTDENAMVDGDFAVLEDELQPVLKSLRSSGINIVAIHQHMTHENPRYIFLHYWGRGTAASLAGNLAKALEVQQSVTRAAEMITNFDNANVGKPPAGWTTTQTGNGASRWTVEKDDTAPSGPNVLKQSGTADYPICLKDESFMKDGFVEVKFKAISGDDDQAAGLVWRAKDADNYYVVRANAKEDNVVLYKTVAGKRSSLDIVGRAGGYGVKEKVAPGQWHTLRVEFAGNRFKAYLNGKHLFDVEDNTFTDAGKVGLWTKADSVTLFDDFSYGDK